MYIATTINTVVSQTAQPGVTKGLAHDAALMYEHPFQHTPVYPHIRPIFHLPYSTHTRTGIVVVDFVTHTRWPLRSHI